MRDYLLFTYPNCKDCAEIKKYLAESGLEAQEYNLVQKESKLKIRDFIIPTLVIQDDTGAAAVLNSRKELEEWLRSRA
jgi:arsenate reductase-like glutaredoxin family protein